MDATQQTFQMRLVVVLHGLAGVKLVFVMSQVLKRLYSTLEATFHLLLPSAHLCDSSRRTIWVVASRANTCLADALDDISAVEWYRRPVGKVVGCEGDEPHWVDAG